MPLELNGFRVHIQCDGKELPQYQVKQVNNNVIRCYIASEAGKVHNTLLLSSAQLILHSCQDFSVHTSVDGETRARLLYDFVANIWADGKHLVTQGEARG